MERPKEFEGKNEINVDFEVQDNSQLAVYCVTCDRVIHDTKENSFAAEMVVKNVAGSHRNAFSEKHLVIVRRNTSLSPRESTLEKDMETIELVYSEEE